MHTKIIIRFDDICPNMNWDTFLYLKNFLEELNIKSLLGVIPENKDQSFFKHKYEEKFFERINLYKNYGDTIAQHGTFHNYTTTSSGILNINNRSEFSGHSYEYQYDLISKGKSILEKNNCWQPIFMAPAHSFDENTLKSIFNLGFKSITDGYGFFPINKYGIDFVPQLSSKPFNVGFGIATVCIHVNTIKKKDINNLINFLLFNKSRIISYEEYINIKCPPKFVIKTLDFLSRKTMLSIRKIKKYQESK
tara:strand:- start:1352 stop:2101 length:750 start_codon:yes stop_codon:yes gene_type:complete